MCQKSGLVIFLQLLIFTCEPMRKNESLLVVGQVNPPANSRVFVQLSFNEISKINGLEQVFYSDFYLNSFWTGPTIQNVSLDAAFNNNLIFDPGLEFVNGRLPVYLGVINPYFYIPTPQFAIDKNLPEAQYSIWATSQQRFASQFQTPLNVHDFPYDPQSALLQIEPQIFDITTLNQIYFVDALSPDNLNYNKVISIPIGSVIPSTLNVVGWNIQGVQIWTHTHYYQGLQQSYARLTISVALSRIPSYYMLKVVLGVVLFVFLGCIIFAMSLDKTDRTTGTLQVFAGLTFFLLVADQDVPEVPYQTRLDVFMNFSFFVVAMMLIVHAIMYLHREDDGTAAFKLNPKRVRAERALKKLKAKSPGESVGINYSPSVNQNVGRRLLDLPDSNQEINQNNVLSTSNPELQRNSFLNNKTSGFKNKKNDKSSNKGDTNEDYSEVSVASEVDRKFSASVSVPEPDPKFNPNPDPSAFASASASASLEPLKSQISYLAQGNEHVLHHNPIFPDKDTKINDESQLYASTHESTKNEDKNHSVYLHYNQQNITYPHSYLSTNTDLNSNNNNNHNQHNAADNINNKMNGNKYNTGSDGQDNDSIEVDDLFVNQNEGPRGRRRTNTREKEKEKEKERPSLISQSPVTFQPQALSKGMSTQLSINSTGIGTRTGTGTGTHSAKKSINDNHHRRNLTKVKSLRELEKLGFGSEVIELESLGVNEIEVEDPHGHLGGCTRCLCKWWEKLIPSRKWDLFWFCFFLFSYLIGAIVIFGRPLTSSSDLDTSQL